MKLKISTIVEIPDDHLIKGYEFDSAVQIVFDDIVNYVTVNHLTDATKWLAESKEDKKSTAYRIFKHHQTWGRLAGALDWQYEEV